MGAAAGAGRSAQTPSGAAVDKGTTRASQPVIEAAAGRQAGEAREDALMQASHGARPVALQGEQVRAGSESGVLLGLDPQ